MSPTTLAEVLPHAAGRAPSSGLDDPANPYRWPEAERTTRAAALRLHALGVRAGDRVVVLHPKSSISFLAMHSALRAQAIAVPVDPLGPVEAIARIIESVEPAVVITASATWRRAQVPTPALRSARIVVSDDPDGNDRDGDEPDATNPEVREIERHSFFADVDDAELDELSQPSPDDRAYIIFTSGSTGRPKGIVHTHRSGLAYAQFAVRAHRLTTQSRLAATSPLHFDMSTLELYAVPLAGASTLTVRERDLLFMTSLAQTITAHAVTHLYAVPYLLKQMLAQGVFEAHDFGALRQVSFGGEQFSPGSLRRLADTVPHAELLNVYGPAEVNGVVSHSFGDPTRSFTDVPIGTEWPEVTTRIVGDDGGDVPAGSTGELLVSSASMMEGYWQMPDRSAASFCDERALGRSCFYRTGDRVHRDADGLLHFHGRNDNRVKVRGVRLELEEIEQVMADAPNVAAAAVGIVQSDGREYIHAWVIPEQATEPSLEALVEWCRPRLPAAAVPTDVSILRSLPTTQSGKVDRRALVERFGNRKAIANDQ